MKKLLLIVLLLPLFAQAQTYVDTIFYPSGGVIDSTTFTFTSGDSLTHYLGNIWGVYGTDTGSMVIDTSSSVLWQIGQTLKPVFSNDTIAVNGIMTDTVNPYPPNANDYFVLEISEVTNFVVDFWHRYQIDSLHAGGVVEFSTDAGATWLNVVECDQIVTQNFYTLTDTSSGQPSFTGASGGEELSRIQFLNCVEYGIRKAATICINQFAYPSPIYLRFRFVSDSTVDSLSGWMIDSIKVENPGCFFGGGGVARVNNQNTLSIFPNPATSQLTIQSTNEPLNNITITNILGQTVYTKQNINSQQLTTDCSLFPSGIYFVKVNGSEVRKFVKE